MEKQETTYPVPIKCLISIDWATVKVAKNEVGKIIRAIKGPYGRVEFLAVFSNGSMVNLKTEEFEVLPQTSSGTN